MSHGKVEERTDAFDDDLHPTPPTGSSRGDRQVVQQTAYDIKALHEMMPEFRDDELKQIPVVFQGERLKQGDSYLNLADRGRGEFRADNGVVAEEGSYYVSKKDLDYVLWNRLVGVTDPERIDAGNAGDVDRPG